MSSVRRAFDRAARRDESMRAKPLTEEARAKLSSSEAQRTGELDKSDRSRSQLTKMSEQLLARMKAATPDQIKKGDAFSKKRQRSWDLLAKREAKALAGTMAAKRAKGTKKKPSDGYSEFRGELRKRKERDYNEEAEEAASPPPREPAGAGQVDGGKKKPARRRSF